MTKFQKGQQVTDRNGFVGVIYKVTKWEDCVWYDVRFPGGVAVRYDKDLEVA